MLRGVRGARADAVTIKFGFSPVEFFSQDKTQLN